MSIVVAVKQLPDLIEELEINDAGTDLDRDAVSFVLNEFDDQALEEALLLKDTTGQPVTVIGVDTTGELDQALYGAIAKGADRALKIVGDFEGQWLSSHAMAALLAPAIRDLSPAVVLTGVQAADDLDGQLAPLLAAHLGFPHVGVVIGVELAGDRAMVRKEYWSGITADLEVDVPVVLGIQAARQPPRYVPVGRVRQAMKEATIEEIEADTVPAVPAATVRRLLKPESAGHAEMIAGDAGAVATRILEIVRQRGIV